ncbi:MAG: UDP-N-acetylmuramoyl-L-alanyl-D-glutamate--2,6-diaminopimelate ligase [Planctomycetota bacterium]|jgi:UDP-N-acetylmuramoyl-L-alanyl-D-glutamate--2,6-diaminopimelate ligase|nr:UDP-N-acetylmuramoyl-L-alanyl-D-glutamate--2,6-diaminopimelate ligase [Planctomycetota bacterium]
MLLSELSKEIRNAAVAGNADPEILSVSCDSREVEPGALFAALRGSRDDGQRYIREAVDRGAAAVLTHTGADGDPGVPRILVEEPRKALGEAADAFYKHPSRKITLLGVTGTNGKTTTAYLVRHLLNSNGVRCGMLGTIEYDNGRDSIPSPLTTPDAVAFTRFLAEMVENGCRAAVAETSSHALEQRRVWPHQFSAAIFTNLTRDHLDYHQTMETYLEAKRILFRELGSEAAAVVNLDDPHAAKMRESVAARVFGFSLAPGAAASDDKAAVEIIASDLRGQAFRAEGAGLAGEYFVPLVGMHNVQNATGALMALAAIGVEPKGLREALRSFPPVPGRLERMESPAGVTAFVDYSHTDGALRSVLGVLRPLLGAGRLITVFGCGGDRDRGKRPLMARAAEERSDLVVVTSDNPRTEDPLAIIDDVMKGFKESGKVKVDPDRARAVELAVSGARPGDVILVAGKGHENYQILGKQKIHLDDRELVRDAFRRFERRRGGNETDS